MMEEVEKSSKTKNEDEIERILKKQAEKPAPNEEWESPPNTAGGIVGVTGMPAPIQSTMKQPLSNSLPGSRHHTPRKEVAFERLLPQLRCASTLAFSLITILATG